MHFAMVYLLESYPFFPVSAKQEDYQQHNQNGDCSVTRWAEGSPAVRQDIFKFFKR